MNILVVVNIVTLLSLTQCCLAFLFQDAPNKLPEQRCESTSDCSNPDKICYQGTCICSKEKPIEDPYQDNCLPQVLVGDYCATQSQCLVDALCLEGVCTCGNEAVAVWNPSTKIFYCQPKRRLEEECNSELQCPTNAYCSVRGCLCSNGYSPANVSNAGIETTECLPKKCSSTSDCEEYHQCDDAKCKCLPIHFDISRAKCYNFDDKLQSGNQQKNGDQQAAPTEDDHHHNHGGDFVSIFKDLTTSDKLWLVLIILISLSLILLILILYLLRKHYLGYCWTAHKKEYEPNTADQQPPKNGHFDKNSINNKSFRRRNGDLEDDAENDSSTEDKSNLVVHKKTSTARNQGDFVAVDLNGGREEEDDDDQHRRLHSSPLKSSTSTPV